MAKAIADGKRIYETLHPEVAYEARPGRAGNCRQLGDNSVERFTEATAKATGMSERTVQRIAQRGTVLGELLEEVRGTALDTGSGLDALVEATEAQPVHGDRRSSSSQVENLKEPAHEGFST